MKEFLVSTSGCAETVEALKILHSKGWSMGLEAQCKEVVDYCKAHSDPPLYIWLSPTRKALRGTCWVTPRGLTVYTLEVFLYSIMSYNEY